MLSAKLHTSSVDMETVLCTVWRVIIQKREKKELYSGGSIMFRDRNSLCTGCVRIRGLAAMDGSHSESLIACLNLDARAAS